jgi:hypothetical protein
MCPLGVSKIVQAEEEFSDRTWYDRKLVLRQRIKERLEKEFPPDIRRGMHACLLAAMKRVEAKYGGRAALRMYYKNDFEGGMMNGKLSALRWVLGDEWDMLDTKASLFEWAIENAVRLTIKTFFPQFILPNRFRAAQFCRANPPRDACQCASLRFNMYVQLFAGRNFVGIV